MYTDGAHDNDPRMFTRSFHWFDSKRMVCQVLLSTVMISLLLPKAIATGWNHFAFETQLSDVMMFPDYDCQY